MRRLSASILAALGLSAFAPGLPAQTFFPIFTEDFEGGGLAPFVETDVAGVPAMTLWHGEGSCSPPVVPPGPPIDLLFTPSGGSYTVTQTPPAFASIAGVPGAIALIPASASGVLTGAFPLFMSFTFFGAPKTLIQVSTEGWIAFDQTLTSSTPSNTVLPSSGSPNDLVAAWWDDLHTGAVGTVWLQVNPGASVVVEWNSVEHSPGNSSGEIATFQVRLNASPANTVELHYDHAGFASGGDAWTATVGIEDASGTTGINPTPNGSMNAQFPNIGGTPVPTPVPPAMGTNAAAYNQGDLGTFTFNTGAANEGGIESPTILLGLPTTTLRIQFDYLKETENSQSFDQCFVQARPTGGAWSTVAQLPGTQAPCSGAPLSTTLGPGNGTLDALVPAGGGQFRYFFDTVDSVANDGRGWYVDNVQFEGNAPGGLLGFGTGCPGTGGTIPVIGGTGAPSLGNLGFGLTLGSTLPGTAAVLILGVSDQLWGALPLPFNLGVLGAPACNLLVSADVQMPTATSPGGTASFSLPIPNVPAFAGAILFAQWSVIDPGAPGMLPIAMSAGLKITIF